MTRREWRIQHEAPIRLSDAELQEAYERGLVPKLVYDVQVQSRRTERAQQARERVVRRAQLIGARA